MDFGSIYASLDTKIYTYRKWNSFMPMMRETVNIFEAMLSKKCKLLMSEIGGVTVRKD